MMQDSLARALGGLKGARMDDLAAEEIRKRLQLAWTDRAPARRPSRFAIPGFARALAVAALVVIVAFSTMRATADSALYGARVAVEEALEPVPTSLRRTPKVTASVARQMNTTTATERGIGSLPREMRGRVP